MTEARPPFAERTLEAVLAAASADDWEAREAAAIALENYLGEDAAVEQLVRMLDDPDTAVIEAAVETLTKIGPRGLSHVLRALHDGAEDAGYHIADRLTSLWLGGTPILTWAEELATVSESSSVRLGAAEVVNQLS